MLRARPVLAAALGAAALLAAACGGPPPAKPVAWTPGARSQAFDGQRAWAHVRALAALGPRVMGTEGARAAASYIEAELTKLGLELREQRVDILQEGKPTFELRNLAARIPGASEDLVLLAAPYDTRRFDSFAYLGLNDGASGVAVLLEIARVLAAAPLPFTTWLVFIDGEAPLGVGPDAGPPARLGSRAVLQRMRERDVVDRVRVGVVVNRVCDSDLKIARDLNSSRLYREEFWRAAERLGYREAFPRESGFEKAPASHARMIEVGLDRVVAIVDTSFGGDEPPGIYDGTESDDLEHCSAQSLEIAGRVALEGLTSVSERLARIDRFADTPFVDSGKIGLDTLDDPPADAGAPEPAPEGSAAPAPAPPAPSLPPPTAAAPPAPAVGPSPGAGSAPEAERPPAGAEALPSAAPPAGAGAAKP